ncbi:MAG: sodium:solute symporter [Microscillaceae bacterium]|nr:sodium:solute symporter [Microscillaceae bacterium]
MASKELVLAMWVLIGVYALFILWLVGRGLRRTQNLAEYALGSFGFSPLAVGLSLAASMTSAATFIINPGFIAMYGWSGVLSLAIALPAAALVSLVILTKGFRQQGQAVKALTLAQWIGSRYQSRGFALFFAFLSLLLITFIVLICVGLTAILSQSLNLPALPVLIGLVGFVFGYMMFGGANAMVYTNMVQAILMIVVAVILLGSGYEHFRGGIVGFWEKLRAIDPQLVKWQNAQSPLFRDFFEIIVCQIVVGVAIVCQPHILTKSLLLKGERDVNRYLWVAVSVEILFFWVVFVGLYARLQFPDLTVGGTALKMDSIMSVYVVQEFSVYVGLLVVMGLIAAGLSTLEGLIQSLSTTITVDIFKNGLGLFNARGRLWGMSEVWFNRLVIIVLGVVSVYLSYQQILSPNLSVGIFAQNGVYAYFSAAFVPVLFGTFLRQVPLSVPVAASVAAVAVHFSVYYGHLTPYTQPPVANPGVASALAILSALGVGIFTYWATYRSDTSSLDFRKANVNS